MLLMNALLTEKRIIFLGNGHPAGDVANFVLAACALGSGSGGVLRGFPERAYPYTNLAGIDHLLTWYEGELKEKEKKDISYTALDWNSGTFAPFTTILV